MKINMKLSKDIITFPKDIDTYLGQKGYTISKNSVSDIQVLHLKELLVARPVVMGAMSSAASGSALRGINEEAPA